MIFQALSFLTNELNAYLKSEFQTPQSKATLSAHVNSGGSSVADLDNQISVTLINLEPESTVRNLLPDRSGPGPYQYANPALKLNLRVLFAANFGDYSESLKFLGSTLAFFQGHALFTPQNAPLLDPAFDRLTVELETTSYQDWSYLWGMLGAKHMPGVIYKIKMITIQDGVVLSSTPAVTSVGVTSGVQPTPVPAR
jgi:hypothetical protein